VGDRKYVVSASVQFTGGVVVVTVQRLARAVRLVDQLGGVEDPADYPTVALRGLARLIGCDVVTYNEIGGSPPTVVYLDYPVGALEPGGRAVFTRFVHQHPLINYFRRTADSAPMMMSDLVDRWTFHGLGLYAEFFATIPVEYQLAMTVTAPGPIMVGFAFNRSTRDFNESDREVLGVLRDPLLHGLLRCRARSRAGSALDATDDLTERERRVLELVADGRTNQSIAHTLEVSPRTIAKHLEHAYRKLDVTNRAAAVATVGRSRPHEQPVDMRPAGDRAS
jgi:DNA-binding CsgD family transcriptional regulator